MSAKNINYLSGQDYLFNDPQRNIEKSSEPNLSLTNFLYGSVKLATLVLHLILKSDYVTILLCCPWNLNATTFDKRFE